MTGRVQRGTVPDEEIPPLTDAQWEAFGYETKDPCVICDFRGDNKIEPRFGYVTCRKHSIIPPAQMPARAAFNGERK